MPEQFPKDTIIDSDGNDLQETAESMMSRDNQLQERSEEIHNERVVETAIARKHLEDNRDAYEDAAIKAANEAGHTIEFGGAKYLPDGRTQTEVNEQFTDRMSAEDPPTPETE